MELTNFTKSLLKANLNIKSFPFKLNFAITWKCNARCKMCNIWMKKSLNELTLSEIEEFARKNPYFSWVSLTGGEPFLRADFVEIVKAFKKFSPLYILNVPTNGFLAEKIERDIPQILKLKIPNIIVTVSIDGNKKIHDYIRGIDGAFDRALLTFKMLKEFSKRSRGFKVLFAYTISPFNVGKFEDTYKEIKREIKDVSVYDFHINIFHHSTHYYSNDNISIANLEKYKSSLLEEIRKILKMKNNSIDPIGFVEIEYLKFSTKFIKTGKIPLQCKSLRSSIFIDPLGNVYPCTIWNVKIGNIRNYNYDIKRIFRENKNKIEKLLSLIDNKKCPNCWTPCEANQTILGNMARIF
jgi:radical SAM protein with 4Fe4S-binding SPASM domain